LGHKVRVDLAEADIPVDPFTAGCSSPAIERDPYPTRFPSS
jgi:hypothetical protein